MKEQFCLITSSDKRIWDTSKRILIMHPGCMRLEESAHLSGDCIVNRTRYVNRAEYDASVKYLTGLFARIEVDLANCLNELHCIDYDLKSWRLIFKWWLVQYVSQIYYLYTIISDLKEDYSFYVPYINMESYTVFSGLDFQRYLDEYDTYNSWLSSRIAKAMGIRVEELDSTIQEPSKINNGRKTNQTKLLMRLRLLLLERITSRNSIIFYNGIVYMGLRGMLSSAKYADLSFKWCKAANLSSKKPNREMRSRIVLKQLDQNNEFEQLLSEMIKDDLPIAYLEGFELLKKQGIRHFGKNKNAFYSINCWFNDEIAKAYVAYARKAYGMTLVGIQHGGTAVFKGDIFSIDTSIVDRYYTWGNKRRIEGCEIIPFPSFVLGDTIVSYNTHYSNNDKTDILFVGSLESRYRVRFRYPYDVVTYDYVNNQVEYIKRLYESITPFRCRLYFNDYGWDLLERAKLECPNLVYDSPNTGFLSSISHAKLCVFDIFMTTWTQAYVLGIPFIIITPKEMEDYYEDELDQIEKLKEVGVYYNDINDAVAVIKQIENSVLEWWKEPRRQAVVDEFAQKYCMCQPEHTWDAWRDMIKDNTNNKYNAR